MGGVRIFDARVKIQHDAQWSASNYRSRPITDFLTRASKFCRCVTNVKTPTPTQSTTGAPCSLFDHSLYCGLHRLNQEKEFDLDMREIVLIRADCSYLAQQLTARPTGCVGRKPAQRTVLCLVAVILTRGLWPLVGTRTEQQTTL